ncbi:MAG: winged helix-turn-helix domain-containing protein [Pseudomonadota bacterium]
MLVENVAKSWPLRDLATPVAGFGRPMIFFEEFSLDVTDGVLLKNGIPLPLEPQVAELLMVFLSRPGRLITRDELIDATGAGRLVSDSAISSRVKRLRRALGDDGKNQRFIRTVPKRGFRFVAEVRSDEVLPSSSAPARSEIDIERSGASLNRGMPTLAVLPFAVLPGTPDAALAAAAMHSDLINELARIKWLRIIARGSVSEFRSFTSSPSVVRRSLGARYGVSGELRVDRGRLELATELSDLESETVIWSDCYERPMAKFADLRRTLNDAVLTALELEIPVHEAGLARLSDPSALTTWQVYHLGLQHLNRFTPTELAVARDYFHRAIELEPHFARAHAALSAAHFQLAFQSVSSAKSEEIALARLHAERSLALDNQDPFVSFVMGRVHWLKDDVVSSQGWLERATLLSPSSASAQYALSWSDAILGDFENSEHRVVQALQLSPLDPFRYGMLGVRAFNQMGFEDYATAADLSAKAASAPGAHGLIAMIAAAAHQLDGDTAGAEKWARIAVKRQAGANQEYFFKAFPLEDDRLRISIRSSLEKLGF